jgi:hypothetical protein
MKISLKKLLFFLPAISLLCLSDYTAAYADKYRAEYSDENYYSSVSLNTVNGKFYAYIVLLYNENQHFVNLIQKGAIPLKEMGNYGFNIKAYKNYLGTIQDQALLEEAQLLLKAYLEPRLFSDSDLKAIEKHLLKRNIVLKFYSDKTGHNIPLSLDYIIYGEKIRIDIKHPLLELEEEMFYIKPYIYYDEFSTSNTTLYYDLIYISPDEVNNDYIIAKGVLSGKEIRSRFFVGSRVTDDIKFCLQRSFSDASKIKAEIWRMFVIHELTHKFLDKKFRSFDQITGEEISLSSTIYSNQYLGLSVMYSYLNYGQMNPHRIAALNYISYIAQASGNRELINNPGLVKNLPMDRLKEWTKSHFENCLRRLQQ